MKSWDDIKARQDATWDFCTRMRKFPDKRKQAIANQNDDAKKIFAENWFYLEGDPNADPGLTAIPTKIEFRVYNFTPVHDRDDLVTIVLPPDDAPIPLPSRSTEPIEDVSKCTWAPYIT